MSDAKSLGLAMFEPQSFNDLARLGEMAARSRLFAVQSPETAVVMMLTGASLGLSPVTALRGIHVVQGRAVLSSDLLVAVVLRSGQCDLWRPVEVTDTRCTLETRRKGHAEAIRHTWTIEMAKKAGLVGKGTWQSFPAAMLRARCSAELARMVYPDVLFGVYVEGEIDEEPEAEKARPPVRVDLDALGVEQPRRVLDAPAVSSWSADLAACSTLADVRACYSTHRSPDTDGAAMVADVRGWCSAQGVYLDAAGVTAALSTLPLDALRVLDASTPGFARLSTVNVPAEELVARIVRAAREAKAKGAEWDKHSKGVVWDALVRAYAKHTGAKSARVAGDALRDAVASDDPPPPTGTDGPAKPANDAATAEGSSVASTGADGATASIVDQIATAWSMSAPGIVEHVAAITSARHLEASGRAHLRAISQGLRTHAVHAYADRLVTLSRCEEHDDEGHRVVSEMPKDEAVSRVERWLREGPRVQVAAKVKRAA